MRGLRLESLMLLALIGSAPLHAAGVDLRPKFTAGQELLYLNNTTMDIVQTMPAGEGAPPQEQKSTMKSEMGMRVKVLEATPEGGAQFEWTLLFMSMNMTGGQMPLDYDSRDTAKQSGPFAPAFKPIVNNPAIVTVNDKGEVIEFKGMDPASLGPMGQMIGQFFSKESFQQMGLLPTSGAPNPAEVGATWSQTFEISLPQGMGTMVHDADFKLTKVEGDRAVIDVKGRSAMKKAEPGTPEPMISIEKGDSQGTIHWNVAKGRMESTETTADQAMGINSPMGKMSMKQQVKSTIREATLAEFKLPPAEAPAAEKKE